MTVQKRTIEIQKQRVFMEKTMENKVQSMPQSQQSDAELAAIIQQYSSMYADYGEYRKKEVNYYCMLTAHIRSLHIRPYIGILSFTTD